VAASTHSSRPAGIWRLEADRPQARGVRHIKRGADRRGDGGAL